MVVHTTLVEIRTVGLNSAQKHKYSFSSAKPDQPLTHHPSLYVTANCNYFGVRVTGVSYIYMYLLKSLLLYIYRPLPHQLYICRPQNY